ncbi:VWA domain-containing protein [Aeromicrobium sp. 636]|uniref:VWA domain-containing protein n=1 Tax=Aeromicrobium senzhongii TaxID=2663859 RepID=A0A8I0K2F2_9ACTN|nr:MULTISPECIES: VWA domain-containing protein [Aeromicrobium]MBC9226254.1 VWA domain-containing protein [Aeromicrobium senzhongii]MCQ3998360.1 VWA domain-containing protein [Aeromicrobium sp. 636]
MRTTATIVAAALAAVVGLAPTSVGAQPAEAAETGSMMLVLDASGSMAEKVSGGGTKIKAARSALRTVIDQLPEDQPVGLRVYGATVFDASKPGACTDSQQVVALGLDNRNELRSAVDDYKPYGETPIGHALREAAKDLGAEGQRTIVLVSDGEPTCDPDPCRVAAQLTKKGFDLRVDVVGLDVKGKARAKLQCIADRGNGTYYDAASAEDLVDTLSTAQTRASRPFDLSGTPVEGTPTPSGAPTVTTGQWLDTFPSRKGELWYRIERTAPGSTIHVGAAHRSTDIGNSGQKISVLTHSDDAGNQCGRESSFARGSLGYAGTSTASRDEACATSPVVYVQVTQDSRPEELAGEPVEIAIYEEPPIAGATQTSTAVTPERPAWTPLTPGSPDDTVVPGTSVSNAPVVNDGTYALDINPGETQAVAVPLDWGQHLQAQFDARITRPSVTDFANPDLQITGPLRQEVGGDYTDMALSDDWTSYTSLPPDEPSAFRWGRQAYTVAPEHRHVVESWWAGSSLPGLRYILVSLPEDAVAAISYTLTLKTHGTAGTGAPEYEEVDDLTPPQADSRLVTPGATSASTDAEPPADTTPTEPPADSADESAVESGFPWLPVGLGSALLVALVAIGAFVVRRRRASDPSVTPPGDRASER